MTSTFRQHLHKRRTFIGMLTLLCLLWHMFLPTLVQTGIAPALYAIPSHCQPAANMALTMQDEHLHQTHAQMSLHPTAHMQLDHQHEHDQLSLHELGVYALASEIMKHCPLCSHGLDAAAILPLLALILLLIVAWFAQVRCLCYRWAEQLQIPQLFYLFPLKQAPPFAL